jgi:hypothetical protein
MEKFLSQLCQPTINAQILEKENIFLQVCNAWAHLTTGGQGALRFFETTGVAVFLKKRCVKVR